jgi:hypothetical protein
MLTRTRTRTQTTLTKLAEMVANVHGELDFLEGLLSGVGAAPSENLTPEVRARLCGRKLRLIGDQHALYSTLRQFDANIDPCAIGSAQSWRKRFGAGGVSFKRLIPRYLSQPG